MNEFFRSIVVKSNSSRHKRLPVPSAPNFPDVQDALEHDGVGRVGAVRAHRGRRGGQRPLSVQRHGHPPPPRVDPPQRVHSGPPPGR